MNPNDLRRCLTPLLADYTHALRTKQDEQQILQQALEHEAAAKRAQELLQSVAEQVQQHAHQQLAGVVTRCLKAVFGEDEAYEFKINFAKKRGRTEAELLFVREGKEIDPLSASGGGAVDVASFALRLACLMLLRPPVRRLLVLDEPYKFLSKEYRPRVRALLEELAKELDLQVIQVTHAPDLVCGKVIEVD